MLIDSIIVAVVVIVVAGLGTLIIMKRKKRRAEVWEGVVTDKAKHSPDGQNMYRYISVKLPDGQTKTIHIHGKLWRTFSIGDKVAKRAGDYNPTKL